mmetsp:Transcript_33070/g.69415  ORF Transcript_33070/g.69415 Transcript_33070/m.69415 type:complete len:139 (-) Transcript_33070:122-538(-)
MSIELLCFFFLLVNFTPAFSLSLTPRQWRPSIERAFDQRRPAAFLLEDSMRFFEKKKLRPLIGWDCDSLFSFDPRYLMPLKSWKVGAGKSKKNKKRREYHVLNNATSPPPLDISPVRCDINKILAEGDIIYSSSFTPV